MYELQLPNAYLNFGLIVVDIQNGFVSKGGSYDKLRMNTGEYRKNYSCSSRIIKFLQK